MNRVRLRSMANAFLIVIGVLGICFACSPKTEDPKPYSVLIARSQRLEESEKEYVRSAEPVDDPLALLNVEDGTLQELPDFPVYALEPSIVNRRKMISRSPDGKYVLFVGWTDDSSSRDIYRADADGSNVVNLTNSPAGEDLPTWSPDGNYIAFASGRDTCGGDYDPIVEKHDDPMIWCARLYVMRPDGSDVRYLPVVDRGVTAITWSPDGQYLGVLLGTGDYLPEFPMQIYIVSLDGSEARELIDLTATPNPRDVYSAAAPHWTRNGNYIYLNLMDIYLLHPDGSGLRRVWPTPDYEAQWSKLRNPVAWSPDGKFIASYFYNGIGLVVVEVETGQVTQLGHVELFCSNYQMLQWTPDGESLVFEGYSGSGKYDIYALNLKGGDLVNLTGEYSESFGLFSEWVR